MKKQQINQLDKLWSARIRDFGCCEICGKTTALQAHHIIGRRNRNVRWDLDNGICLCAGCHIFKTQSAHQDPLWFNEKLIELLGQEFIDDLARRSRISCMAGKQDFNKIKEYLEKK